MLTIRDLQTTIDSLRDQLAAGAVSGPISSATGGSAAAQAISRAVCSRNTSNSDLRLAYNKLVLSLPRSQLSGEQYQSILNDKIFYRQDIELEPGSYTIELMVKDRASGRASARREKIVLPIVDEQFLCD